MNKRSASSRNALKHGLAAAKWVECDKERIATLAELFKNGRSGTRIEQAARQAAEAREYHERVIATRDAAFAASCDAACEEELEMFSIKLDRLERYERQATLQWERALAELELALLE